MRFEKIIVENFGPFKNPTTINFTNNDGVSIVWGRNGRGKTTLLNAFNFVLNNTVVDRNGVKNDYLSFVNEEGFAEGKCTFKVILDVDSDGERYRIVRKIALLPTVTVPKSNDDLRTVLMVNSGGAILPDAQAEHIVKSLMTPEVSRFFLFDGELLTEYEELLNEHSETGGSIKKSIAQILGMPVLTNGALDAGHAVSVISTEARKVAQNEEKTKKHAKAIEEKQEDLDTQIGEKERLEKLLADTIVTKNELQNKVDDTQKLREFADKKKSIEQKIDNLNKTIESERQEVVKILSSAWRWMLAPVLTKAIDELEAETLELSEKESAGRVQSALIDYIAKAIEEPECPICGHINSKEERQSLTNKLAELNSGHHTLSDEEKKLLLTNKSRIKSLKQFIDNGDRSAEVINRCEKIATSRVSITDLTERDLKDVDNDLEAFKKTASGADIKQAIKYYEDLATTKAEIKEIEKGIHAQEAVIAEIRDAIAKLNATILKISGNKDVTLAQKKVAFAESIRSIFTKGIDQYRDKLSRDVEADATEIFMAMNTEEDYGGLQINSNYGLTIVRKSDGKPVTKRSAGWEHMVAFALIGALHKNAPFDGPVIMDSPFYRLDKINTASMVKALPLIARQVLMLPYPGEIDEIAARRDIGDSIVQELQIVRVSSNESTIEEMV